MEKDHLEQNSTSSHYEILIFFITYPNPIFYAMFSRLVNYCITVISNNSYYFLTKMLTSSPDTKYLTAAMGIWALSQ